MVSTAAAVAGSVRAAPAVPRWIVCTCDGYDLGVPLDRVREIVPARPITRLPGGGPAVCGLIGLRGRIITVFDLAAALGLAASHVRPEHRLLLLEHGDKLVAFAVDAVKAVASGAARDLALTGASLRALDVDRAELLGIGELDDDAFMAIDPDPLLRRLLA